jgi:hypothetical protein
MPRLEYKTVFAKFEREERLRMMTVADWWKSIGWKPGSRSGRSMRFCGKKASSGSVS